MRGKLDETIALYQKSLARAEVPRLRANSRGAHVSRLAPFSKGDYEGTIRIRTNLGRVYVKQGQFDEAIAQLRLALAIAPQYRPARAELHRLLGLLN